MSAHSAGEPDGGHVRFDASQVQTHESEITLQYARNRVQIHLGFLQINRHYTVDVVIHDELGEDITFDRLQNLYAKVLSYKPTEDGLGHELQLEFHAHKEKLVQEKVTITSQSDPKKHLDLVLHARVLGKGKGTPALRNGIKCIKVDADDDSDGTDWQGFD